MTNATLLARCASCSESSPLRGSQKSGEGICGLVAAATSPQIPSPGVPPQAAKKYLHAGFVSFHNVLPQAAHYGGKYASSYWCY